MMKFDSYAYKKEHWIETHGQNYLSMNLYMFVMFYILNM